jgi:alpha-tubulin suppressor-like RCC1 family protein
LGQNDVVRYSSPVQIPGTQWSNVVAGYRYVVATKTDNTLWVWGVNSNAELGLNDIASRSSPTQIPGTGWGNGLQSGIDAGQYMTWALKQTT